MKKERIRLWKDPAVESYLVVYRDEDEDAALVPEPAMLIFPGGGYENVCEDYEGEPVAMKFREYGMRVFVLNYRIAPHRYPEPLDDALRAVRLIRGHAVEWGVIPDNIAICGFSAGGHLAASAGIMYDKSTAVNGDEFDVVDPRPNALVLSYPVITGGKYAHKSSVEFLLGTPIDKEKQLFFSLEKHIKPDTPPTFVWAASGDVPVPVENTLLFEAAMRAAGRICEMHIFPGGWHGMRFGQGRKDIAAWPELAVTFLSESCGFVMDRPTAAE